MGGGARFPGSPQFPRLLTIELKNDNEPLTGESHMCIHTGKEGVNTFALVAKLPSLHQRIVRKTCAQ